jgi:adenosylcobinamide kinase/adenosylcobinamide-phosphate guanylyltransferase
VLAVLTGPVRSGKSRLALRLAAASGRPVLLAVAGLADDAEMERRIERHRAERSPEVRVLEIDDVWEWLDAVPADVCLVLDCLGTLVARMMGDVVSGDTELADVDAEERLSAAIDALVDRLVARGGDTVVVTNEVGWGVVPATASGRLFRDVLGRANARLADAADAGWLVVAGRAIHLTSRRKDVTWPR